MTMLRPRPRPGWNAMTDSRDTMKRKGTWQTSEDSWKGDVYDYGG